MELSLLLQVRIVYCPSEGKQGGFVINFLSFFFLGKRGVGGTWQRGEGEVFRREAGAPTASSRLSNTLRVYIKLYISTF